jgi:hypothetical protein
VHLFALGQHAADLVVESLQELELLPGEPARPESLVAEDLVEVIGAAGEGGIEQILEPLRGRDGWGHTETSASEGLAIRVYGRARNGAEPEGEKALSLAILMRAGPPVEARKAHRRRPT